MQSVCTLVFVFFFSVATAQMPCPCDDPNSGATFMGFPMRTECQGECDNGRVIVTRTCRLSSSSFQTCSREERCTNETTCGGLWTEWANIGQCTNPCGKGKRKRQRICYRVGSNFRTTSCAGANGTNEQNKFIDCNSLRNCSTPPPPQTTTATRAIADSTTSRAESSKEPSTSDVISHSASTLKLSLVTKLTSLRADLAATTTSSQPLPILENSFDLTLPLVLCSVAIICVAVIVAFVIVFKRRPPDQIKALVSSSKDKNNDSEKKIENHNYEMVGPALPSRKLNSNPDFKNGDISLTVHNVLYSRDGNDQNGLVKSASSPMLEDGAGYLNPISIRTPQVKINDEIPRPTNLFVSNDTAEEGQDIGLVMREKEVKQINSTSVPRDVPKEGDYIKDISLLMKKESPRKDSCNKDLSDLSYVTIDQLKSRNII